MKANYNIAARIYFISFIVLFNSLAVYSQNWQCFYPGRSALYLSGTGTYRAVRFDSVSYSSSGISYRNFSTFNKNLVQCSTGDCFSLGPSWIGTHLLADSSGNNYFFNAYGDTLCINTLKLMDESWEFCKAGEDSIIEAYISSIEPDTILGNPDQVKIISFRTRNSSGEIVPGILDYYTLGLSMNYGLVSTFGFFEFDPSAALQPIYTFTLAGLSDQPSGIKNLSLKEANTFEPGDVFHIESFSWSGFWDSRRTKTIRRVISAEWNSDSTVTYLFKNYSYTVRKEKYDTYIYQSRVQDTVTYPLNSPETLALLPSEGISGYEQGLPGNWYAYQFEQSSTENYNFRRVKTIPYRSQCSEECIKEITYYEDGSQYNKITTYIEGCGVYEWESLFGSATLQGHSSALKYYKKGNETWGDPFDTTLWIGMGIDQEEHLDFLLFPNPASDHITVQIPGAVSGHYYLQLINAAGTVIQEADICSDSITLSLEPKQKGLMLIRIYKDGVFTISRKILII